MFVWQEGQSQKRLRRAHRGRTVFGTDAVPEMVPAPDLSAQTLQVRVSYDGGARVRRWGVAEPMLPGDALPVDASRSKKNWSEVFLRTPYGQRDSRGLCLGSPKVSRHNTQEPRMGAVAICGSSLGRFSVAALPPYRKGCSCRAPLRRRRGVAKPMLPGDALPVVAFAEQEKQL